MSPLDERGFMIEFPLAYMGILGLVGATVARLLGVGVSWVMFVFFGIMLLPAVMLALTPVGPPTKRNGRRDTKSSE